MENDFSNGEITAEDLSKIPNPFPEFYAWVGRMWASGGLNRIVEALIKSGAVNSSRDALLYLNEQSKNHTGLEDPIIAGCDFVGEQMRPLTNLGLVLGDEAKPSDPYHGYGTFGHKLIPEMYSGKLFEKTKRFSGRDIQLALFGQEKPGQLSFLPSSKDQLSPNFNTVKKIWKRINKIILKNRWASWYESWFLEQKEEIEELKELYGNLFFLFKNKKKLSSNIYLSTLTLLSWASAMVYFRENGFYKRIIFPEINVLPSAALRLIGGRVDGIELTSVAGQDLNKRQKETIRKIQKNHLSGRYRIQNIGHLAQTIATHLRCSPQTLRFKIYDWKFSVGDGKGKILKKEDVPLYEHIIQMKKYITLASVGINFAENKGEIKRWQLWERSISGQLVYFFSNGTAVEEIRINPSEKEKTFLEEVVLGHQTAEKRAKSRLITNHLIGHTIGLLNKKTNGKKNGNGYGRNQNLSLFPNGQCSIKSLIERYKHLCFVDSFGIIEKIKPAGSKKIGMIMNADRLLERIEEGKVETKGMSGKGGFVSCLMPDHPDSSPSMHISFQRGIFKCFSCGAYGSLNLASLSKEIKNQIQSPFGYGLNRVKISSDLKKIAIPEEHTKVMELAQESLQLMFGGSEAERYIEEERKIDPDLAFSMGAGFGTDILIHNLMDSGLSLDQLVYYGFASFSHRLDLNRGLGPLLKKRGLRDDEIGRKLKMLVLEKKVRKSEEKIGYPYARLSRRITFPLEFAGRITNFYGRAIDRVSAAFKHRKLSAISGVPQGAFNIKALDSACEEIFATEAVIESLALISLGIASPNDTVAIVGTGNDLTINTIANSGKRVALALNYDKPKTNKLGKLMAPGQDATKKMLEMLRQSNCEARDFTAEFIVEYPELGYGDYNDFLKKLKDT